jgi:hypothetical protein
MITPASSEWMLLSAVYHHVLTSSPSPGQAQFDIMAAKENGQLRFRAEQRKHVAMPGLRPKPGEQPPENEPIITPDQPLPKDNRSFDHWDWERSRAITRNDPITKSVIEYVDIVVHRDDVLKLWPAATVTPAGASNRGRKEEFDWECIYVECVHRLIEDGAPSNVSKFAEEMLSWCQNQLGEKGTPDLQTMRKKITVWISAYKRWLPRDE